MAKGDHDMSAPTKCDRCGVTGTFAIAVPCAMGCGGTMHYDRGAAPRAEPSDAAIQAAKESLQADWRAGLFRNPSPANWDAIARTALGMARAAERGAEAPPV